MEKHIKQAPEGLVKEMFDKLPDNLNWVDAHFTSEKCAQIAIKHAEKSNEKCLKLILHFQLFLSGKGYCKDEKDERALLQEEIDELLKQYGE